MLKRGLILAFALGLLANSLQANVYFVNKGVKYHIGDDRSSRSVDSEFLDTYPTVGQIWMQAFTVNQPDVVRVSIANIWGVDDCEYCKAMVSIGDHDMGRLSEENNHTPFNTPAPLSYPVQPGRTYYLKISSIGKGGQADDFAIEGVSIETDKDSLTLLDPGPVMLNPDEKLPVFEEPKEVVSPCEGTKQVEHWLPLRDRSRSEMEFAPQGSPVARRTGVSLGVGEFVDVYAKVDGAGQGDAVDQFMELLLGDPSGGWVLSFGPGAKSPSVGNFKRAGRYGSEEFSVAAWKPGSWNQLRIARCEAGAAHLWLNGRQLGNTLPGPAEGSWPITLRSGGLVLKMAEKPIQ